jgi:hypothetical protein
MRKWEGGSRKKGKKAESGSRKWELNDCGFWNADCGFNELGSILKYKDRVEKRGKKSRSEF